MQARIILPNGKVEERTLTRAELASQYSVHNRDLRSIYAPRQLATILIRGQALIINLSLIDIICDNHSAVLLGQQHPLREEVIRITQELLKDGHRSDFGLIVLDAAITASINSARKRSDELERLVLEALSSAERQASNQLIAQFLQLKKRLTKHRNFVREVHEALEGVLDDEDLIAIFVNREQGVSQDEVESVLEHTMEQFADLEHRADILIDDIEDTEESITIQLSIHRNEIIRIDLMITLITMTLSGMAVVAGFFGMNLKNGLAESPYGFWLVVVLCSILGLLMTLVIWRLLRQFLER